MERRYGQNSHQNLWDKIWRDKHGKVIIWQFPNAALWVWAGFTTLSLLFSGIISDILAWIASAGLIVWAFLEIFKGANYFRRLLGLTVLIYAVMTVIRSI